MRKFDTKVQHLKYKVLREVARLAWDGKLLENLMDLPITFSIKMNLVEELSACLRRMGKRIKVSYF